MKKIIYIYIGDIEIISGITNKLKGLFSAFDSRNVEWKLFTLSSLAEENGYITPNIYALPYSQVNNTFLIYESLHNFIESNNHFDIYFFRYPLATGNLIKFLKKHPFKFIFEHNTKELPEMKLSAAFWIKKFKIRLTPSYASLLLSTYIRPVISEFYNGKKALRLSKKGVAVTNEIALYQRTRFQSYKCSVLSNGIDVEKIAFFERKFARGQTLNMIMLINSSAEWHGADIIINAVLNHPGNNIKLFLVGDIDERLKLNAGSNVNIIFTGHLQPSEYQRYLQEAHLGIGSLATYRIKLEEAATLKVREYLASGLPICLGYTDNDVEHSEVFRNYRLKLSTDKKNINLDEIYNWALYIYGNDAINSEIRGEAYKKIDFLNRVDQILEL